MSANQLDRERREQLIAADERPGPDFARRFVPLLRMKIRLRRPGAPPAQVADIIQETLARALDALKNDRLVEPARLGGFISGICDNVLRENARSVTRDLPLDALAIEPQSLDDPETTAAARERAATAERVVRALPAREREVLRLIFVEEVSKDEVCARFRITRDHLRVIVCRAREHLRTRVEGRDAGRARTRS